LSQKAFTVHLIPGSIAGFQLIFLAELNNFSVFVDIVEHSSHLLSSNFHPKSDNIAAV
jgi:hypothetical protein